MAEGLENCRGWIAGDPRPGLSGYLQTVVQYVRPRRRWRQPEATMRFETAPGEQAQVDWGSLSYIGTDGQQRRVWVFVDAGLVAACYVELGARRTPAAFPDAAFEYLGGVPHRCLYDTIKVITLGRTKRRRSGQRMLDFARRVGFEARLASPTEPRPRARWRTGSSTCGATCGPDPLHRRRRPEPAGTGVVRRAGQRAGAWNDPLGALNAGQVAAPTWGSIGHADYLRRTARCRGTTQLGGLPVRRPLEMVGATVQVGERLARWNLGW